MKRFAGFRQLRAFLLPCGWSVAAAILIYHLFVVNKMGNITRNSNIPRTPSVPPPPSMVILLTYMRSGSSLVGDVIQQHPDVFYMYEPIHTLNRFKEIKMVANLLYLEHETRRYDGITEDSISRELIENVLTCQQRNVDLFTLMFSVFAALSKSHTAFSQCRHRASLSKLYGRCVPELMEKCSSSKLSLVKTIRFSMENAGALMQSQPSLKVIHLIRDPRATLLSQSMVGNLAWGELRNASRRFCQRVSKDLQVARRLASLHPGRLLTLRYDDLAQRPLPAVEALYRFLGLEFDAPRRQYVYNITQSGRPNNCAICTTRANSTATALRWRKRYSSFGDIKIVQEECASVMHRLGYLSLSEMTLRNLSVPSKTEHLPLPQGKLPL